MGAFKRMLVCFLRDFKTAWIFFSAFLPLLFYFIYYYSTEVLLEPSQGHTDILGNKFNPKNNKIWLQLYTFLDPVKMEKIPFRRGYRKLRVCVTV